ncbi:hypothetical protein KR222_008924, partial [Zaprionus bogoriensis]
MFPRLAKCCFVLNLRLGCMVVIVLDICLHLVHLDYGDSPLVWRLAPVVSMGHFMGCYLLFLGISVEVSYLLLPYLVMDIVEGTFLVSTAYIWFPNPRNTYLDCFFAIVNICIYIY